MSALARFSVLLAICLLLVGCWRQVINQGASVEPSTSRTPNLDFDFDPGAGWTSERDGQAYIFNDIQSMRQITIAVLNARSVLSDDELVQASRETLDIRKKIIRQLSSDRATFTDMGVTESEGGIDTSFSAVDPLNQVQIYCTVKARPLRVVTVSFNKYSPYLSDEDFRRQAESLIGSVKVN